jgi:hypothetical protein
MSEHFALRLSNPDNPQSEKKKYCLHCSESYSRLVSTATLKNHYNKLHKSQSSIIEASSRSNKLFANQQLSSSLSQIFAVLNWPLHHTDSNEFKKLFELIRQTSVAPPHRQKLRASTIALAKVYRER